MCAKLFCTILVSLVDYCTIPVSLVDLQLQLQLYSCTSIQIQQRVLVALKGLHTVVDPEVYIRWKAYLRYSSESSALDPFGLDPITVGVPNLFSSLAILVT